LGKVNVKNLFLLLFLGSYSLSAYAEVPKIEVRGFGTAGLIKSDHPSYFLEDYQTNGSKLTFNSDSRIGLNLISNFAKDWNITAQFTARSDTKNYTTFLDWGFVSYQFLPELSLRMGKITTPLWLYSQQIDIGYSYIWIRPPVEVYSLLNGIKSMNGASALSSVMIGSGVLTTEIFAGEASFKSEGNNPNQKQETSLYIKDALGLDLSFSKDDIWTLHASYAKANTDAKIESTFPFGTNGLNYTSITQLNLGSTHFFSAGGKLDYKNVLLTAEFARRLVSGQSLQSASAWYATGGYRIGKLIPYYTYSWQGSLRGTYYIHPSYPTVTSLKREQYSHLFGVNVQVHDSVVLKGEVQRTKYEFLNPVHDFRTNIFSFCADFLF
jgi:hypothetical protein